MAYKDFQAADVLTAQEVDEYLMRQSVMVFDSATARNLAITAPTEGMMVYLKDTKRFQIFDGSSWAGFSTTGTLLSEAAVRANSGGPDGGITMRQWTGGSGYTGLATHNMTSNEYLMLSEGTNQWISAGVGGAVHIRAGNDDSSGQVKVSANAVELSGRIRTPNQPYVQAYGTGGQWFYVPNTRLRLNVPGTFAWATAYNVGNHWDNANGYLIAPVNGVYLCSFSAYTQNYGGLSYHYPMWEVGGSIAWNGGTAPYTIFGYNAANYPDGVSITHMIYTTAGNAIGMQWLRSGNAVFYSDYTYLGITLLG